MFLRWNRDQGEMLMRGRLQLNKRKHFQTMCIIKTEEAALWKRELPFNLGGSLVWCKKMDQVLISVLPSARHMSRGKFPYAQELSFLICTLEVIKPTHKSNELARKCLLQYPADIRYSTWVPANLHPVPPSFTFLWKYLSRGCWGYHRGGSYRGRWLDMTASNVLLSLGFG